MSVNFWRTPASEKTSFTAALRRVTTSPGVALGTIRPNGVVASRPGRPASAMVGTSGSRRKRSVVPIARPRSLPAVTAAAPGTTTSENSGTTPLITSRIASELPL